MGTELTSTTHEHGVDEVRRASGNRLEIDHSICPVEADIPVVPWLDEATAALVRTTAAMVACRHPDLRAVVLYGSIARHDERPLDDLEPSDVDLLLVFDLEPELDRLPFERRQEISHSIGLALRRHMDAPREVNAMPVVRDLADWDEMFVENVARDGLLLWARGPLPDSLAAVAARSGPQSTPPSLDKARTAQ